MTGIRKIFIFSFAPWDTPGEPEEDKRGFVITFKDKEDLEKFADWSEDDEWYDFLGDMEGYGVHDFGTSGFKEIIGYHSYEIRMPYRDEVMNKWRERFITKGYECGDILTELEPDDHEYDRLNLSNVLTDEDQASWNRLAEANKVSQVK